MRPCSGEGGKYGAFVGARAAYIQTHLATKNVLVHPVEICGRHRRWMEFGGAGLKPAPTSSECSKRSHNFIHHIFACWRGRCRTLRKCPAPVTSPPERGGVRLFFSTREQSCDKIAHNGRKSIFRSGVCPHPYAEKRLFRIYTRDPQHFHVVSMQKIGVRMSRAWPSQTGRHAAAPCPTRISSSLRCDASGVMGVNTFGSSGRVSIFCQHF